VGAGTLIQLWKSLLREKNQKSIAFFATGFAALVTASWTAFTYIRGGSSASHGYDTVQVSTAQVAGTVTVQGNLVLGMTREMVKQQIDDALKGEREQRKNLEDEIARLKSEQTKTNQNTEELARQLERISSRDNPPGPANVENRREIFELTIKLYGSKSIQALIAMNNLGIALTEGGRFHDAETVFREAYAIVNETLGNSTIGGNLLRNFGSSLYATGRLDEAEAVLNRSLEVLKSASSDPLSEAATLNSLGLIYSASGRTSRAMEAFKRAQSLLSEAGEVAAAKTVQSNLDAALKLKPG
jgi:tetratricopeptide (TPR) repeat protein